LTLSTRGPAPVTGPPTDFSLPAGISPWWLVLFLLGSAIMAGGLRRLPDRVLEADDAIDCPLEAGT